MFDLLHYPITLPLGIVAPTLIITLLAVWGWRRASEDFAALAKEAETALDIAESLERERGQALQKSAEQ